MRRRPPHLADELGRWPAGWRRLCESHGDEPCHGTQGAFANAPVPMAQVRGEATKSRRSAEACDQRVETVTGVDAGLGLQTRAGCSVIVQSHVKSSCSRRLPHLGMATELGKRFNKHVEGRCPRGALVQGKQDGGSERHDTRSDSLLQQSQRASQSRYRQQQKPSGCYR